MPTSAMSPNAIVIVLALVVAIGFSLFAILVKRVFEQANVIGLLRA